MARILLVDDDPDFSEFLKERLEDLGHEVHWLELAEEALEVLPSKERFDVVLLDNRMPRMSGIEFLAAKQERSIRAPVILMTSAHNDQTAIDAINNGAEDYVIKPVAFENVLEELNPIIEEVLAINRRPRKVNLHPADDSLAQDDSTIVGRSKAILNVLKTIGRVAETDDTILVLGETGTGKDLVATAIHTNSRRKDNRFVPANCTAFHENLLDDELFGHESGAFTGAEKLRKGCFEHAHGGTLFLDEVGDMPLNMQAKLLRVLENREVVRLGSNDPIKVDVRVVAATHRDLKSLVQEGRFREDLYYRLEGMTLRLPPLRERMEDIVLLANRFLRRMVDDPSPNLIHPAALEKLQQYHWPGNIRQLQKVLRRAVACGNKLPIMPEDLDFGEPPSSSHTEEAEEQQGFLEHLQRAIALAWEQKPDKVLPWLLHEVERELFRFVLERQPKMSEVQLAKQLGISRTTLRDRIERYER